MIKFEDLIISENKLFSNGNSLEVTRIIIFNDVEFSDITFNNYEIKYLTNIIEYGKNINGKGIQDSYDLYFKNCIFSGKLEFSSVLNRFVRFDNCTFDSVVLKDIYSSNEKVENGFIFKNIKLIKNLIVDSCELTGNFYIKKEDDECKNKININDLYIVNSVFSKDFSLNIMTINNIKIKDCDFNSLSEFIDVEFVEKFDFQEITYKGLTLFDDCKFNTKAEFKYIIFEKFTSFRGSKFSKGINLDYASNDKDVNFYGVTGLDSKISKQNTSQETYRIIKNQFEKLNNKIEANKYHALELEQRKKELEKDKWKNLSEYVVFKIHDLSSKHSTSYFRAILWIIFISFFTISLVHFDIVKDLFFHPSNFKFEYLPKIWSEFWQYINITNLEKLKDKPFIFFFNKVSLGYLYYQFLTAVRKDTRK